MSRFTFSLQGVLRHREHIEQEKQRDLARLQLEMRQHEESLRALNQSVQSNVTDIRDNRLLGKLDMNYLAAHRRYMLATQRQVTTLAQKMALLQRQIDDARRVLAEAAKQRKILEKLRDRQKERWMADLDRREAADLDEVSMRLATWKTMTDPRNSGEPAQSSDKFQ